MSETVKYLVTMDAKKNTLVKVEKVGEKGDLAEVDAGAVLAAFGVAPASAGASPQIVVNIYAAGHHGGGTRGVPPTVEAWTGGAPPEVPLRNGRPEEE